MPQSHNSFELIRYYIEGYYLIGKGENTMELKKSLCVAFALFGLSSAYVVKNGDTMWDLSAKELRDPFKWTALWQNNPAIKNPHLIFPGDVIQLPGKSVGDADSNSKRVSGDITTLDAEFKRKLGAIGKDPNHRPVKFDTPTPELSNPNQAAKWLNRSLQLQAPFWVQPISSQKVFEKEYRPISVGTANGQIIQNGQLYLINIASTDSLPVNKILELYENNEPRVRLNQGTQRELVSHKPLGFAKVVESTPTNVKIKVEYLLGDLRVDRLMARPNPNHFPVEIESYKSVEQIDMANSATLSHIVDSKQVSITGDWYLLNKGSADGFEEGDAVVIWDRQLGDTSKLRPEPVGFGLVVRSSALGSSIILKRLATMKSLPQKDALVSVYAKAVRH